MCGLVLVINFGQFSGTITSTSFSAPFSLLLLLVFQLHALDVLFCFSPIPFCLCISVCKVSINLSEFADSFLSHVQPSDKPTKGRLYLTVFLISSIYF